MPIIDQAVIFPFRVWKEHNSASPWSDEFFAFFLHEKTRKIVGRWEFFSFKIWPCDNFSFQLCHNWISFNNVSRFNSKVNSYFKNFKLKHPLLLKSVNLKFNTVGRRDDDMIVPPSLWSNEYLDRLGIIRWDSGLLTCS